MKFNPIPIALLALLNGARGAGELKRWLFFALVFGCAFWINPSWLFASFWTLAVACWLLKGWSHGLSIVNLRPMEIDTTRSDYFIVKLARSNKWFYWLIRSSYMLPVLIFAAIYYGKPMVFVIGLLILLQGLLYFIGGRISEKHGVRIGEFLTGGVIVVMMCLTTGIVKGRIL